MKYNNLLHLTIWNISTFHNHHTIIHLKTQPKLLPHKIHLILPHIVRQILLWGIPHGHLSHLLCQTLQIHKPHHLPAKSPSFVIEHLHVMPPSPIAAHGEYQCGQLERGEITGLMIPPLMFREFDAPYHINGVGRPPWSKTKIMLHHCEYSSSIFVLLWWHWEQCSATQLHGSPPHTAQLQPMHNKSHSTDLHSTSHIQHTLYATMMDHVPPQHGIDAHVILPLCPPLCGQTCCS